MAVFHLDDLGWNAFFQQYLKAGASHVPGRVVEEQRSTFRVACETGELINSRECRTLAAYSRCAICPAGCGRLGSD